MKDFKESLKILEKSKEFKDWKNNNKDSYLSYALFVLDEKDIPWKIGFCNKNNKITSFNVDKKMTIDSEDKAFQKERKKIKAINLDNLKLTLADAVKIATELQKEEYTTENPKKIIAIIQNLDIGQVWNITFLTQSFNTLNMKIKSDTGRIIEKKIQPLFGMDK